MNFIEEDLNKQGFKTIAGIDEAGRGSLAGPLVSAAIILELDYIPEGIKDSKKLTEKQREAFFEELISFGHDFNIVAINSSQIDNIGIQRANLNSFHKAISGLSNQPDYIVSDWFKVDGFDCPCFATKKGEDVSINIAAASILAKVYRDRLMYVYDQTFPGYGFASHKGYGTSQHFKAIKKLGPSPIHRMTFRGVKEDKKLFD